MNASTTFSGRSTVDFQSTGHVIGYPSAVYKLSTLSETQPYRKGQVLYNENAISRGIYIIKSGLVKVSKYGTDGKEQIIKILHAGEVLGYQALLSDFQYHEYAEVLEDGEIAFVYRDDFDMIYHNDAEVMEYFTKQICEDLRLIEDRLVSMAYEPVRGRIASLLLSLMPVFQNGTNQQIRLSRSDLANIVGTAKETTIRILSEFRNENLITSDGQNITVLKPEGLERIVALYR